MGAPCQGWCPASAVNDGACPEKPVHLTSGPLPATGPVVPQSAEQHPGLFPGHLGRQPHLLTHLLLQLQWGLGRTTMQARRAHKRSATTSAGVRRAHGSHVAGSETRIRSAFNANFASFSSLPPTSAWASSYRPIEPSGNTVIPGQSSSFSAGSSQAQWPARRAAGDVRQAGGRDSVAPTRRFGAPNPGGAVRIARFGSPLPSPDSARRQ
jgi:hypothetical protein